MKRGRRNRGGVCEAMRRESKSEFRGKNEAEAGKDNETCSCRGKISSGENVNERNMTLKE